MTQRNESESKRVSGKYETACPVTPSSLMSPVVFCVLFDVFAPSFGIADPFTNVKLGVLCPFGSTNAIGLVELSSKSHPFSFSKSDLAPEKANLMTVLSFVVTESKATADIFVNLTV